jgi:hypothetical protein
MQKKPKKRFLDAQILIGTIAMTVTIALWNIIASAARQTSSAAIAQKFANEILSKNPDQVSPLPPAAPTATSAQGLSFIQLPPVKILLGGKMPVPQVVVVSSSSSSTGSVASSSGGSTGSKPPPPVTTTSSSHK